MNRYAQLAFGVLLVGCSTDREADETVAMATAEASCVPVPACAGS